MRIALATVGTAGDARPFAALARALAEAGHDVTAIAWNLHAPTFAESGATFVAAGPSTTEEDVRRTAAAAAAARSPLDQVGVLRDLHLRDGAAHHAQLREVLRGHEAAVIHGIHALAVAAARDEGLRHATVTFDPVLLPTRTAPPAGMPSLGPLNGLAWWMLDRALAPHDRALAGLLAAAGSTSTGQHLFRDRSPLLHLVAVSPAIAPPAPDLPSSVAVTGAWTDAGPPRPLPRPLKAFLAAGPPPVVVSFGSMALGDGAALAEKVRDAIAAAGMRGVVQAGASGLHGTSDDRVLFIGEADHRALLPRAGVVIHHGGSGTSHAAARAGVPQVVVPHVGDQRFWAARLHALGVAPAPLPATRLTGALLAERLREAGADAVGRAATALAARIATENGTATAMRLIAERLALR
ncbi:MAG TPA: glycosyltransferase [Candidatus Limnocylindria bacterium]|nr:glycosyltransferase [Candidatus Limnocylindria bacterium]